MSFGCCLLELMNKISKDDDEHGACHLDSLLWSSTVNGENTRKWGLIEGSSSSSAANEKGKRRWRASNSSSLFAPMEKTQYDDDEPFSLSSFFATNEKKGRKWQRALGLSLFFDREWKKEGRKMTMSYVVTNEKDKQEDYDEDCHHLLIFCCNALNNKLEEWRWVTRPIIVFWSRHKRNQKMTN